MALFIFCVACGPVLTAPAEEQVSPLQPSANVQEVAATFVSAAPNAPAGIVAMWNDSVEGWALGRSTASGSWGEWCTRRNCGPSLDGARFPLPLGVNPETGDVDQDLDAVTPTIGAFGGDPAIAGAHGPGAYATGIVLGAAISSSIVRGTCSPTCTSCVSTGDLPPGQTMGCQHPFDAIVAFASFDGGATFDRTIVVNEGTGPCDIRQPSEYTLTTGWPGVDRPHIAYAVGGPPSTFWVEWNEESAVCLRRVDVNPGMHTVTSPGPSIQVPVSVQGPGDAIVRSAGGILYVMYADATLGPSCFVPGATAHMGWYLARSIDGGAHWTNFPVWSTETFNPCFGALGMWSINANGTFGFDIAPDGVLWAAFHDAQGSIRIVRSLNA